MSQIRGEIVLRKYSSARRIGLRKRPALYKQNIHCLMTATKMAAFRKPETNKGGRRKKNFQTREKYMT